MHELDSEARFQKLESELAIQARQIAELSLSRRQRTLHVMRRNKRAIFGGVIIGLIIPVAISSLSITKSHTFSAGNPTVASEVNANFDQLFVKVNDLAAFHPPIGTILAWHKSLGGVTPALPASGEWVECNGQILSDPQSPYNTHAIPNLNNPPANPAGGNYPGGYFLRGALTSGTIQDDRFQGHWHAINRLSGYTVGTQFFAADGPANGSVLGEAHEAVSDGTNGTPRIAAETRPVNMSVVWIMKVK